MWSWERFREIALIGVQGMGTRRASRGRAPQPGRALVDAARHLVSYPQVPQAQTSLVANARDNRWANSVVALNGETGEFKWGQQLVHHDCGITTWPHNRHWWI